MSKEVIIIGAGASGRGHMGQLAFESEYELTFLEKNKELTDILKARGAYTVHLAGGNAVTDREITGFNIFHVGEKDKFYSYFKNCPLIFTTVVAVNLSEVGNYLRPLVVKWLKESSKNEYKNIMCCENMNESGKYLKKVIFEDFPEELKAGFESRIGFPDTMIARVVTTPKYPYLELLGEEYSEWTADKTTFRGPELPQIKTLQLVEDQERYLKRKLYIHNTGHATFGYLGFLKGHKYIHEAAQDESIMNVCRKAIEESGWAIQKEYGFSEAIISAYRNALTDKCPNAVIPDEITRVVRDPLRKLGKDERFIGPLSLMLKHGRKPHYLLYGICAALLGEIPGDKDSETIKNYMAKSEIKELFKSIGVVLEPAVLNDIINLFPVVRKEFGKRFSVMKLDSK
ncbi:MAG: Mannitol-1-phosphate 5-dehydrogenase [Smithella sp. PtaU1.Bin162]|nr:MAG: Mannitol-1-phosphate 5-dehydrogenase [Smithella sp. PtaU1.Bin162]